MKSVTFLVKTACNPQQVLSTNLENSWPRSKYINKQKLINKSSWAILQLTSFTIGALPLISGIFLTVAKAESIIPANDGTGTVVNTQGNNIDISGGTLNSDRTNLFHSFSEFGLDANQTANFLSQPSIQNILGRVTGGNTSVINGLITVTGGNSNLYLINPSGIIFGANASLNLPASFTATTANRIGFGENWFNAQGINNYATLLGNPQSFAFDTNTISAIINEGNLTVNPGNNLTLLGGTIASTGEIAAPGGKVTVATVPGTSLVRLSIGDNPLSLEIQPLNSVNNNQSGNSLATMLTGGSGGNASSLIVNSNGEVELFGSGLQIQNGDVVAKKVTADTATLAAKENLLLPESQLSTTGNLNLIAGNTVKVRDSESNTFAANTGGNLYIQGKQGIDVLALNSLQKTPFISGRDLTLVSDGKISLDAHFASGGKFSILNSQGTANSFISLYDPIISSENDVIFGNYEGPALKVESRGSIIINGSVTITSPDFNITDACNCSEEAKILGRTSALILRAGVSQLIEPFSDDASIAGLDTTQGPSTPGNVTVTGDINTSSYGGPVIVSATGDISLGNIDALVSQSLEHNSNTAGKVELIAGGNIQTGNITSTSIWDDIATGGEIKLEAGGNIKTENISSFAQTPDVGSAIIGAIDIKASGNIDTGTIDTSAFTSTNGEDFQAINNATAGSIKLESTGGYVKTGAISSFAQTNFVGASTGGAVNIQATGNIDVISIDSFANSNIISASFPNPDNAIGGQIALNSGADITTGLINSSAITQNQADATSGLIDLQAAGNIITTDINSFATAGSVAATGGDINLVAGNQINTNAIISGADAQNAATGGDINLQAANSLTTGRISTSVNSTSVDSSVSGGVTLKTLNIGNNIIFDSIDTRAVSNSRDATPVVGGNVDISANGTVQGLSIVSIAYEFSNNTIVTSATNALGLGQSGSVRIEHDGGFDNAPFIIGDESINGLRGNIKAGNSEITTTSPVNTFPVLPNGGIATDTPSNITIASINTPPTLTTGNTQLPTVEENQSVTFTFGDLLTSTDDVNLDNRSVILDEITAGTLTLEDGTAVTANTVLNADTILVYTPPENVSGNITAFSIKANDRVSFSTPQNITINVTPKPIEPTIPEQPTEPTLPDNLPNPEELQKQPYSFPKIGGLDIINDSIVTTIEEKFSNEYLGYLEIGNNRRLKTFNEAREILQKINRATGVKPAIIYVNFAPESVSSAGANIVKADSDRLELILVTSQGQPVRKVVNVSRAEVLRVAQVWKRRVTDPELGTAHLAPSQQMHDWLIQPLEADLQNQQINNLVFILDTGLRSLPLAALHDGQQYIVERYSIGLMPSLSLSDTTYVDIRNAEVLGMGASKFSNQQPLPAVPTELKTITSQLWSGKSFLNEGFTLKNLQLQRQQKPYGIIHLATHGEFKPGAPNNSYIQLWDSQLKLDRLRELGWNNPAVELAVLSACRTALGDEEAELGFAGFAVQAGAKSVLASLWYVSDEGTLGLMSEFYDQLKVAPIKAEALRRTQLAMIKGEVKLQNGQLKISDTNINLPPTLTALGDKDLQHPYFWSAFTMIGNPW